MGAQMLTCREVTSLLASGEVSTVGQARRLATFMHLIMCRYCRRYAAGLRRLGALARKSPSFAANLNTSARIRIMAAVASQNDGLGV